MANDSLLNRFFRHHSFKVLLAAVFVLPIFTRGARLALQSNDNDVHDWLPKEYRETADFNWFQQHFDNETFVLASWEGCTLGDPRLELFAQKLVPERAAGGTAGPTVPPYFKKVETGERLLARLTSPPLNLDHEQALARLKGLFVGPDGEQTCAVITLTDEGKVDPRKTVAAIYDLAQRELSIGRRALKLGGPPVDNVAISEEGEKTLLLLFVPAGIVGISLAYWCLRSVRLTVMVFTVAVFAGAISLSVVKYSGGTMNAILLSMPAVVYVTAISGAIHFANYYRDAVAQDGVTGAPVRALKHAWVPCLLSAITTSAGLISLYTSELMPIKWFGVYSAIGVLSTLALLFLVMPAWMQVWPARRGSLLDGDDPSVEDIDLPLRARRVLRGTLDRHRAVFASLILVMAFCAFGLPRINTSIKLTKLFSADAEILQNYRWLEDKLGPLVPMEVVVRIDENCPLNMLERMELVARLQRSLDDIPVVGNTMAATTFAPSLEAKRRGLISARTVRDVLGKKLAGHRQEFMDNGFLAVDGQQEMWRVTARVNALNDVDYGLFIGDIRAKAEPVLAAERARAAKVAAARAERDNLTVDPKLAAGDWGIHATYTGLVPLVYKAQRAMLNGLAENFIYDLLTVAAVMTVVFRDLSAGLVLFIPSVFPLVIVFGMMGWKGVLVDVGTVMAPVVALGVSVDDAVHFLMKYRSGLAKGMTRKEATMLAYENGARAMYQSWAVLGLGLAVFSLSRFVPTQRFGSLMFLLLSAALVGNLFMLPTTLNSPLGWLFGRRLRAKAAKAGLGAARAEPHVEALPSAPPPASSRRDPAHRPVSK